MKVKLPPIEPLRREWVLLPGAPDSDNDDVKMSSISSINAIWAGRQRSKITYNIPGAKSHENHLSQSMRASFHLPDRIPAPVEIADAPKFLADNSCDCIRSEWRDKLRRLEPLGADLAPLHAAWSEATPPAFRRAAEGVKPVLISHLLAQLGKGGQYGSGSLRTDSAPLGLFLRTACPRLIRPTGPHWGLNRTVLALPRAS